MRTRVFTAFFALATAAFGQAAGSLTGVVVDASTQAPLGDVAVTARSPSLIGEQTAVSDADGNFEMTLLPAGTYDLLVKRDGFQSFAPGGLVLKGHRVRVRLALMPNPVVQAPADAAVEFNDTMTAPAMISGPAPEYTPEALDRGIEGTMSVRCVVTVSGQVRNCKVLKGLPYMDSAVLRALQSRRYKPALADGKPVDVYYTFTIRLKLPQ
ncbi:MAG: TonB family protein [Myxococcales bacterium]|nr:TonB family protein [Myxococcales bacterium]